MVSTTELLEAALGYARRGWRTVPLHGLAEGGRCSCDAWRTESGLEFCGTPGKHPRFKKYAELASTDQSCIRAWWKSYPLANVGVISGKGSRLIVLDTDPRNGGDWSRHGLIERHGKLPDSPTCVTGGKGLHEHFRWPADLETDQAVVEIADGVEVLLEGHNVVMPPSFAHAGGQAYFWDVELSADPIPEAPAWLVDLVKAKLRPGSPTAAKKPVAGESKWPPADVGAILSACEWMRFASDHAASLSEPQWYAQLSILGRCENGEHLAHELSKPHPGYSRRATAAKLRHALEDAGPVTCLKVRHSLGGERFCDACASLGRIKSPIVLGMERQRDLNVPPPADVDVPPANPMRPAESFQTSGNRGGKETSGSRRRPDQPPAAGGAPPPIPSGAGPEGPAAEGLPEICVSGRQLREVADEAVAALVASNVPPHLFQRGGRLVSIVADEKGRYAIRELGEDWCRGLLTRSANFYRYTPKGKKLACAPPPDVVKDTLNFPRAWLGVDGVTGSPILRPDGSIVDRPGYDSVTRLYYAPDSSLRMPELDPAPGRDHLDAALGLIETALEGFPFRDDASRANAIAAMLTPIVKPAISAPTPMALIDAPQAGTGKSLMADMISLIATGFAAEMYSQPGNPDELRKTVTTVLAAGTAIAVFDNVTKRLDDPELAKLLTEVWHADRIFGTHQKQVFAVTTVFMGTGNNVVLAGDLPRRCYWIRLDAKTSRPFQRGGFKIADLKGWTAARRGELLAALLTLARAWFVAGRPVPALTPLGSFEVWSVMVGGILEFAGVKGFLDNAEALYVESDLEGVQWAGFLEALDGAFYGEAFSVAMVVERLQEKSWNGTHQEATSPAAALRAALPDALAEVIDKPGYFQRRTGKVFSQKADQRTGESGIYLARAGLSHHAILWRVCRSGS